MTAKYPGKRGNDICIKIAENVDESDCWDVETYLDAEVVDAQTVTRIEAVSYTHLDVYKRQVQQTEQPRKRETAKKAEILSFLTEVMRDEEEADLKTRMKAAELLGKRESLFEKKTPTEKESRVIIVDDLP